MVACSPAGVLVANASGRRRARRAAQPAPPAPRVGLGPLRRGMQWSSRPPAACRRPLPPPRGQAGLPPAPPAPFLSRRALLVRWLRLRSRAECWRVRCPPLRPLPAPGKHGGGRGCCRLRPLSAPGRGESRGALRMSPAEPRRCCRRRRSPSPARMRSTSERGRALPVRDRRGIQEDAECHPGERSSGRCSGRPPPLRGRPAQYRAASPAAGRRRGAGCRSRRKPARPPQGGQPRPAQGLQRRALRRYGPAGLRRGARRVRSCRARIRRGRCRSTRRARSRAASRGVVGKARERSERSWRGHCPTPHALCTAPWSGVLTRLSRQGHGLRRAQATARVTVLPDVPARRAEGALTRATGRRRASPRDTPKARVPARHAEGARTPRHATRRSCSVGPTVPRRP